MPTKWGQTVNLKMLRHVYSRWDQGNVAAGTTSRLRGINQIVFEKSTTLAIKTAPSYGKKVYNSVSRVNY